MKISLADMLTPEALRAMEASGRRDGTDGDRVREAYGLRRSNRLRPLRDSLRARLAKPDRAAVLELTSEYTVHHEAARVAASAGIDPVDLVALAIWGRSIDVRPNGRMTLGAFADPDGKRLVVSVFLGPGNKATWEFDERERDRSSAGTIEIRDHPLPESVLIAAAGRPLETLLSHPATDGAGILIRRASLLRPNNSTWLELARVAPSPLPSPAF